MHVKLSRDSLWFYCNTINNIQLFQIDQQLTYILKNKLSVSLFV